jgi:hypothetical protein
MTMHDHEQRDAGFLENTPALMTYLIIMVVVAMMAFMWSIR